jgi:hypothetical protein
MDTTLILRIREKGFYVSFPGVPPTRTPADLDITKCNINIVLSYLRSTGIKDFHIISKNQLEGERIIKSKDILNISPKKEKQPSDNKEVEKRLSNLENMIGKLLTKDNGISKDHIKNKLDFLEVLIKNLNISEQNIDIKPVVRKEPEIEELDTFIPEIDISSLSMKGSSTENIISQNNNVDDSAVLLSNLLNQGKRGGEKWEKK